VKTLNGVPALLRMSHGSNSRLAEKLSAARPSLFNADLIVVSRWMLAGS
jgi:hypothetical protein